MVIFKSFKMKKPELQKIEISFNTFESALELPGEEQELVNAAKEAAQKAYAPYSGFGVGAAVRLNNGLVITGNNQENAAYPSGLCAERVALFSASSQYPEVGIKAIAVTAIKGNEWLAVPVPPCGSCRQVFVECENRFKKPFIVIMAGARKIIRIPESNALMPFTFDGGYL
jgi:cytidine deaminase